MRYQMRTHSFLMGMLCMATLGARHYAQAAPTFTDTDAVLAYYDRPIAAWGDYDNDGDLDLALTGQPQGGQIGTRFYRNDNGSFVEANAAIPAMADGAMAWWDVDRDGDLDLLVTGRDNSLQLRMTYLCRNDGFDQFTLVPEPSV